MAHQAHNLPWTTLASHLKFIRENKRFTPHITNLFPRGNDSELNDVNYLVGQLCKILTAFAITERAKYPKTYPVARTGPLFDAEVIDENLPWIDGYNAGQSVEEPCKVRFARNARLVENWTAKSMAKWGCDNPFNDVIGFLIDQNQCEALLRIAQHPAIDTATIWGGNYQDHYKIGVRDALLAYVVLNVVLSKPELCTNGCKDYMETKAVENLLVSCSGERLRGLINLAHVGHRKFIGLTAGYYGCAVFDPLEDVGKFRDWMKHYFEVMVRYEMFEGSGARSWLEAYVPGAVCWQERNSVRIPRDGVG
jgi:hypothetical protein